MSGENQPGIRYIQGDATNPQGGGPKIIIHVVNNQGGWGAGFVLALSRRWREPEHRYRSAGRLELGMVQLVPVEKDLDVANMCAQMGYGRGNRNQHRTTEADDAIPLRYDALWSCLEQVANFAKVAKASIHAPRIGCGLAGGRWERVEPILQETLAGIPVFVYDLVP